MRCKAGLLFLMLLASCGGASQESSIDSNKPAAVRQSEDGIEIVRKSFRAMGGLERLRLVGAKVAIRATVVAQGKSFPVEITLGGPNRWRLDYVDEEVQYLHLNGRCTKVIFGIPTRCTTDEAVWVEPTRILNGLLFPAGDAANLKAVYQLQGETTIADRTCDVVEIKSQKANLRYHAAYSRETSLLVRATLTLIQEKDAQVSKTIWTINVSDWREMNGILVPFMRAISRDDQAVWNEISASVDTDSYDEGAFNRPVPPVINRPLIGAVPARRVVRTQIGDRMVEIPAPYSTIGGGPDMHGAEASTLPPEEKALLMIVKANLADIPVLEKKLTNHRSYRKSGPSERPRIILFEDTMTPVDPVYMMLYIPLK